MKENKIKKYYKIFAFANLGVGVFYILLLNSVPLTERIESVFFGNLWYHLFYFFISKVPILQLERLKRKNSHLSLGLTFTMVKLIASAAFVMSIFIIIDMIWNVITKADYEQIIELFVPLGLLLGSLQLKLNINEN